jgi:hypothetical protein
MNGILISEELIKQGKLNGAGNPAPSKLLSI